MSAVVHVESSNSWDVVHEKRRYEQIVVRGIDVPLSPPFSALRGAFAQSALLIVAFVATGYVSA